MGDNANASMRAMLRRTGTSRSTSFGSQDHISSIMTSSGTGGHGGHGGGGGVGGNSIMPLGDPLNDTVNGPNGVAVPPPRPFLIRMVCSLHTIIIVLLLFCVVSSTAVAWVVNVTTASRNAANLAKARSEALVQLSKELIISRLQDSIYFSRSDYRWFSQMANQSSAYANLTTAKPGSWEFLSTVMIQRLVLRHIASPSCFVSFTGTSDDLLIAIIVNNRGTENETWIMYSSNATQSPMYTRIIQPQMDGSYRVLEERPPTAGYYQTHILPWFVNAADDVPTFDPIYFSGASSVPYLLAGVRYRFPNDGAIVFSNGVRTDGLSEQLRANLTVGQRLYVVERSFRGALLASSHGRTNLVIDQQSQALSPLQSDDPLVRQSAILLSANNWDTRYQRESLGGGGEEYFIVTEPLNQDGLEYVIVQLTSVEEVMREVNRANTNTIIACSLIVVFDLCVALALGVLLSRPLNRMSRSMVDLSMLKFRKDSMDSNSPLLPFGLDPTPLMSANGDIGGRASTSSVSGNPHYPRQRRHAILQIDEMETAFVKLYNGVQSFAQYVPLAVLRQLVDDKQHMGMHMESRRLTVMFCDIAGFTKLCETTSIEVLLPFLTRFFDTVSCAITANNGTIDKYIGDCVMAIWNAPIRVNRHERFAVKAVLQIRAAIDRIQNEEKQKKAAHANSQLAAKAAMTTPPRSANGRHHHHHDAHHRAPNGEDHHPENPLNPGRSGSNHHNSGEDGINNNTATDTEFITPDGSLIEPQVPVEVTLASISEHFDCRIGVNTDDVMVGSFGSSVRLAYTCVGSGVNLAARLEPFNKDVGTWALLSESTHEAGCAGILSRFVGTARFSGCSEAVRIHEPLCAFEAALGQSSSPQTATGTLTHAALQQQQQATTLGDNEINRRLSDVIPLQPVTTATTTTTAAAATPAPTNTEAEAIGLLSTPTQLSPPKIYPPVIDHSPKVRVFKLDIPFNTLRDYAKLYSATVMALESGNVPRAQKFLSDFMAKYAAIWPADKAVEKLEKRIAYLQSHPPPKDWDGTITFPLPM